MNDNVYNFRPLPLVPDSLGDLPHDYPVAPAARLDDALLSDACDLLERYGYPRVHHGRDIVALRNALELFLHGETT